MNVSRRIRSSIGSTIPSLALSVLGRGPGLCLQQAGSVLFGKVKTCTAALMQPRGLYQGSLCVLLHCLVPSTQEMYSSPQSSQEAMCTCKAQQGGRCSAFAGARAMRHVLCSPEAASQAPQPPQLRSALSPAPLTGAGSLSGGSRSLASLAGTCTSSLQL